jgi:hypothetical protein
MPGRTSGSSHGPTEDSGPPDLPGSTGSHLLGWAVGLSTDSNQPLFTPVCLIAAGVIEELHVRHFEAHVDRTTVVTGSGQSALIRWISAPVRTMVTVLVIVDTDEPSIVSSSWSESLASGVFWRF